MDMIDTSQLVTGFRDRMAKLALFEPLFELRSKRRLDRSSRPVDLMELGLLTLLFFFEQKLLRNSRTGVAELSGYLRKVTHKQYDLTDEDVNELARQILGTFRPSSGKKRDFGYFNWETLQPEQAYISIIRAHAFDLHTNTQYYTLDEDGLELVFATKEFYMEFQLSIHQLVLRKQLEKGEFEGALRQINEMNVDVESLQDRMATLEHELKRNIVSEETFLRYKTLLEDIYSRLYRENEEFEELRQFVRETKDRIHAEVAASADQRPYQLILRISNELESVHSEHTVMFRQSMELKVKALTAARESLYYTGLESFNFQQDIAGLIFGTPLPLESMKGVIAPFLELEQAKQWSLLTVLAEQNIHEDQTGTDRDNSFLAFDESGEGEQYIRGRKQAFIHYTDVLLELLEPDGTSDLMAFIARIRALGQEHLLELRSIYDYWLILHQRSPIRPVEQGQDEEEHGDSQWLEAVFLKLGKRTLIVAEQPLIMTINERFVIQNMTVQWEEERTDGV